MDVRTLFTVVIVVASLGATYGLKCRSDDDNQHQEEFQEVAKMCMSNMSNWDRPSTENNRGGHGNDQHGSSGGNSNRENINNNNNNPRSRPKSRNRRDNDRNKNNNNNNNNDGNNNNKNNTSGSSDSSTLEHIEPCIIHCIFRQMQMLDGDAMPDKISVTNVMMRGVRDSKVKEFVEEAVDECFELMESENKGNKCDFAKNLALCLEEKGRSNCDDWDEPESQKQNGNNSNNNDNNNKNNKNGGTSKNRGWDQQQESGDTM